MVEGRTWKTQAVVMPQTEESTDCCYLQIPSHYPDRLKIGRFLEQVRVGGCGARSGPLRLRPYVDRPRLLLGRCPVYVVPDISLFSGAKLAFMVGWDTRKYNGKLILLTTRPTRGHHS
jgi:hypothetical protein